MLPWLFYNFDKAEHFAGAVLFLAVLGRQVKGVLCGEKLHDLEAAFAFKRLSYNSYQKEPASSKVWSKDHAPFAAYMAIDIIALYATICNS